MPEAELHAVPLEVLAAAETDRGCRRSANEDTVLVRSDIGLYVVADGAGGHSAGNVASAIAASTVAKQFDAALVQASNEPEIDAFGLWTRARRLSIAVQRANQAVAEIARSSNKYRGMGTTIVCALIAPESARLHLAHVGDSRAYRLRYGRLEPLTFDHSILNDVAELYPELDDAALARLPRRAVTRALGVEDRVRVTVRSFAMEAGDRYLLCSDGLTIEVPDETLEELLRRPEKPSELVPQIVALAKEKGGRDNITVLLVDCRSAPPGAVRRNSTALHVASGTSAAPPAAPVKPPAPPAAVDPGPEIEIHDDAPADPEIVMFHAGGRPAQASDPRISVVPVDSADAETIRAIDRVAGALSPAESECPACKTKFQGFVLTCPRCGHSQAEPLSRR